MPQPEGELLLTVLVTARPEGLLPGGGPRGLRCPAMEALASNLPVVLIVLAVALVVLGIVRRLLRLAFFGAAVGLVALLVWPVVSDLTG